LSVTGNFSSQKLTFFAFNYGRIRLLKKCSWQAKIVGNKKQPEENRFLRIAFYPIQYAFKKRLYLTFQFLLQLGFFTKGFTFKVLFHDINPLSLRSGIIGIVIHCFTLYSRQIIFPEVGCIQQNPEGFGFI